MSRLTKAEQAAAQVRDRTLAEILAGAPAWDVAVVRQAILAAAREQGTVSANSIRELLPETGHGLIAAAFRGLSRGAGPLVHTGRYVPSTSPGTKGHPVAVYAWRGVAEAGVAA